MSTESQELADRLAELAGWTQSNSSPEKYDEPYWYRSHPNGSPHHEFNHPFHVGSLDALERFRRERLPEWEWLSITRFIDPGTWQAKLTRYPARGIVESPFDCPDEWSARASALIAACTKEPPHAQP